jgi:hypothetical protein
MSNMLLTYDLYHLALKNPSPDTYDGIYANGLLVETCCETYLRENSKHEHITLIT